MLCKHPEETAAALRRVREEAECVKLGGQSKIDSVYLPKQRYMFDVVVALVMRRHTECSHIYIYAYGIQNLRICFDQECKVTKVFDLPATPQHCSCDPSIKGAEGRINLSNWQ